MTEAGWTGNAPTKEGWYWWQRTENDNPVVVWVNTFHPDKQLRAEMISGRRELLTHFSGLFKGPLSPTDRQRGRVVSCAWKYDDIDDYYETACKHAYCLADGTLKDNEHKYCPYCGGLIQLAQQAQDEKGVGDAGN